MKTEEEKKNIKNKRNVFIEVPDRDEERGGERKFKINQINENYTTMYDEDKFK